MSIDKEDIFHWCLTFVCLGIITAYFSEKWIHFVIAAIIYIGVYGLLVNQEVLIENQKSIEKRLKKIQENK